MKIFIALILAALFTFQSGAAQAQPRLLAAPQSRDTWRSVRTNNVQSRTRHDRFLSH